MEHIIFNFLIILKVQNNVLFCCYGFLEKIQLLKNKIKIEFVTSAVNLRHAPVRIHAFLLKRLFHTC